MRLSRQILRGWGMRTTICGLVALLLAGCTSTVTALPPTTTTTTASPTASSDTSVRPPPVSGPLGSAPSNCPAAPPLSTMTQQNFGGGFIGTLTVAGGSPAWQLGLGTGGDMLHLDFTPNSGEPYPSTKVMWLVGPNYAQPVTLTGHETRSGAPLWFQIYPSNSIPVTNPDAQSIYTTHAVLDPAAPNRGSTDNTTGHWNIWGIGVIVLAAGCYELDVAWSTGGWHTIYAFGR